MKFTKKFKFITLIFLVFQLLVFFNFSLAKRYICPTGSFIFKDIGQKPQWLESWANFDGIHYLEIARKGYGVYQQAFFPLYPTLIRFFAHQLGSQFLLSGFLISSLSFYFALFIFYDLIKLDWSSKIARTTLLNLIIFPTSFFFAAVYTESLFLFLILLSFYLARKKKWFWVPFPTAFATATRPVGIFLLPALLVELWQQQKKGQKIKVGLLVSALWLVFIGSLGLLWYMNYLQSQYADPLKFIHVQPAFGAQRTVAKIVLLYQVFWRYLKMILTCQKNSPLYFTVWLELSTAVVFLALLIFAYLKKVRPSYLLFALLSYLLPPLTGTFLSLPRFVLVIFPCFIALSLFQQEHRFWAKAYLILSVVFLFLSQFFFSQGYWVA